MTDSVDLIDLLSKLIKKESDDKETTPYCEETG